MSTKKSKTPTFIKHCVVKTASNSPSLSHAFARCVNAFKKKGAYSGNAKLSKKGRELDKKHASEPDASSKLQSYENLLKKARKAVKENAILYGRILNEFSVIEQRTKTQPDSAEDEAWKEKVRKSVDLDTIRNAWANSDLIPYNLEIEADPRYIMNNAPGVRKFVKSMASKSAGNKLTTYVKKSGSHSKRRKQKIKDGMLIRMALHYFIKFGGGLESNSVTLHISSKGALTVISGNLLIAEAVSLKIPKVPVNLVFTLTKPSVEEIVTITEYAIKRARVINKQLRSGKRKKS